MDTGQQPSGATILASSQGRGWRGLEADLVAILPGRAEIAGTAQHRLGIHFGRPVKADCRCDGRSHRRIQKHGDIDIVPAGLDGVWEDDRACTILRLKIDTGLFRNAMIDLGRDPDRQWLVPTFQLRDPRIETIAWAIKAELEADVPSDCLYADTLAVALAIRMAEAGGARLPPQDAGQVLSPRQKSLLADFIECHLDGSLSLAELGGLAGLSLSHLKMRFRNSFGMPPHQYVLRRRVERAQALLAGSNLPMSEIAIEAGFAHQSHMANSMKRLLGVTPGEILRLRH